MAKKTYSIRELNILNEKLTEAEAAFEIVETFVAERLGYTGEDTDKLNEYVTKISEEMYSYRLKLKVAYKIYQKQLNQESINRTLKNNGLDHFIK